MSAELKILKPGYTDITSSDIWKFIFHSDHSTFKIATSGSSNFTITAGSNSGYHSVSHNLGYDPVYFANILKGTRSYQVPADLYSGIGVPAQGGGTTYIRFYTYLPSLNTLRIGAYTADGANVASTQTFTAYWIINLDEF